MNGKVRVGIVDDQELVRGGVRMILEQEPDVEVVGEAGDAAGAVALVEAVGPDVLLMDVRMPGADGIEATEAVLAARPATRVLMLTTFDLDEYVYGALRAGASGFLLKDMAGEDIATAVRQAARGTESLLAPAVTRRLVERFTRAPRRDVPSGLLDDLTAREREVLRLVAAGLSNAEIAAHMTVAHTTVKTHVARILMKLGVRDRVQAVIVAYETGLVGPSSADPCEGPGAPA
ncbi:MAG: response regulator [Nocardioidaceae bacterium]